MIKWYKIYIRSAFNEYEEYLFKGTKESLMTLIGCLYSTRLVKIERIDYHIVTAIDITMDEITYYIDKNDNIHISTIGGVK